MRKDLGTTTDTKDKATAFGRIKQSETYIGKPTDAESIDIESGASIFAVLNYYKKHLPSVRYKTWAASEPMPPAADYKQVLLFVYSTEASEKNIYTEYLSVCTDGEGEHWVWEKLGEAALDLKELESVKEALAQETKDRIADVKAAREEAKTYTDNAKSELSGQLSTLGTRVGANETNITNLTKALGDEIAEREEQDEQTLLQAKAYADDRHGESTVEIDNLKTRTTAVEGSTNQLRIDLNNEIQNRIEQGSSLTEKINTAKAEAIFIAANDATTKATAAIHEANEYADHIGEDAKEYTDAQVALEAERRTGEDKALGTRIDGVQEDVD